MTGDMTSPTPQARLLIVDDEASIREGLRWSLQLSGFHVEEAESGPVALAWLERAPFDVLVVDMNMPGMGGVQVMQAARQYRPDLAIIVLTGHATLESAIAAVKSEAVDYLLKPVSVHDLKTAVNKALQDRDERLRQQRVVQLMHQVVEVFRQPGDGAPMAPPVEPLPGLPDTETGTVLRCGLLVLDVERRTVMVSGSAPHTAELTEGEVAVLQELMRHPEQVRSCRQLVKAAWGYDMLEIEATSMVRSYIYRLRKKIEVDSDHPQMLKTVRGGAISWRPVDRVGSRGNPQGQPQGVAPTSCPTNRT